MGKKLKAQWSPQFEDDFNAKTSPKSMFYDKAYVDNIIAQYGSIENYKSHEDYFNDTVNYYGSVESMIENDIRYKKMEVDIITKFFNFFKANHETEYLELKSEKNSGKFDIETVLSLLIRESVLEFSKIENVQSTEDIIRITLLITQTLFEDIRN